MIPVPGLYDSHRYAAELVAVVPDVILADGAVCVSALQDITRSAPIVFAAVPDPVGAGFVKSFARTGPQYHWVYRI